MTILINESQIIGKFDYKKYFSIILSILPVEYIGNLKVIHIVDKYENDIDFDSRSYGCYVIRNYYGEIFINIGNLSNNKIPSYLYKNYPEISALFLSEILGHEYGHHVNAFYVKYKGDSEEFAKKYAESCYYFYLKQRRLHIYISYYLASVNFLIFNRNERMMFRKSINDIKKWTNDNKHIDYPGK